MRLLLMWKLFSVVAFNKDTTDDQ